MNTSRSPRIAACPLTNTKNWRLSFGNSACRFRKSSRRSGPLSRSRNRWEKREVSSERIGCVTKFSIQQLLGDFPGGRSPEPVRHRLHDFRNAGSGAETYLRKWDFKKTPAQFSR